MIRVHVFLYSTDLGSSWAPAVAETSAELNVIRAGNSQLSDIKTFWVGGSTGQPHGSVIQYEEYRTDDSGKYLDVFQIKRFYS